MTKGIVNNRDKFVWDNAHKPDISDVASEIDGKMDDLLDDHDDKVVDIVGDNMNDLLDAHDDKVVSIVGDNMGTLLTGAASTVQLIANDLSGITSTPVKVGKWDANNDIYAIRFNISELPSISSGLYSDEIITSTSGGRIVDVIGTMSREGVHLPVSKFLSVANNANVVYSTSSSITYRYGSSYVGGSVEGIVYYLVSTT